MLVLSFMLLIRSRKLDFDGFVEYGWLYTVPAKSKSAFSRRVMAI